jgi:hypothetical protein
MSFNACRTRSAVSVISVVLALMAAGCNDCDFAPHCEGNVGVYCGEIDQQVGRTETRVTCTGANPVCVQDLESYGIFCATTSKPVCTPETDPLKGSRVRCDGRIERTCHLGRTVEGGLGGYERAMDCGTVHEVGKPPGNYECKTTPTLTQCQPR